MYRVFFYHNGGNAHIDTDSYGYAVSMAYGEVYSRNVSRAWVIKQSGEAIYIATRQEDDSIMESIIP